MWVCYVGKDRNCGYFGKDNVVVIKGITFLNNSQYFIIKVCKLVELICKGNSVANLVCRTYPFLSGKKYPQLPSLIIA